MKKRYMAISAAVAAGMIMAGGAGIGAGAGKGTGVGTLSVWAKEDAQEETGGIRAKAPQGSAANQENGVESETTDAQTGSKRAETGAAELSAEEQAARDAALADAELAIEELTGFRIKQERDDGRTLYEVELYVDAEEYSYEMDAETLEILESDYEREEDYDRAPKDPDALTKEEASQIVLEKVEGATDMDLRIKYDYDDGKELYEGDIVYGGTEYEFEMSARDGQILEWSEEKY